MTRADLPPGTDPRLPLISYAILAPSSHNTQPWRFRLSEGAVYLYADRIRALPVNDPDDRELTISCGCALMNLRVAAARFGLAADVRSIPDAAEPDLLARIDLRDAAAVDLPDAQLFDLVERRRTYRKRFSPRDVADDVLDRLAAAAQAENARLSPLLADEARRKAAELVAQGDAMQWSNPSWRRELAAWMHPRRSGDGLTVPGVVGPLAQLVVRTFDMGNGVGAKDRELAEASPLLAVLATDGDGPADWLAAGQALQRVLLEGCRSGLQASYLNQPVQTAALRPKLQHLIGAAGFPQILLRMGYATTDIPKTARRPLGEVID